VAIESGFNDSFGHSEHHDHAEQLTRRGLRVARMSSKACGKKVVVGGGRRVNREYPPQGSHDSRTFSSKQRKHKRNSRGLSHRRFSFVLKPCFPAKRLKIGEVERRDQYTIGGANRGNPVTCKTPTYIIRCVSVISRIGEGVGRYLGKYVLDSK